MSLENSEKNAGEDTSVDVESAERAFGNLSKQLSRQDNSPNDTDYVDVENNDQFDLEAYLRDQKQQEAEAGHHDKHVDIVWDITVQGLKDLHTPQPTFASHVLNMFGVVPFIKRQLLAAPRGREEFDILNGIEGFAKAGEMVLVLGRPGSGCSSFLKVIANQTDSFGRITGDVTYNGVASGEFKRRFRGETVYNQEDDVFLPSLTVGQTLGFAMDMKTPGRRIAGLNKSDFEEMVIHLLLQMFNIEHTRDTAVGDAFIRGVSGGERKRVSIAEMMTSRASVCCWDNTTRGLDASTALDFARSLRIVTDIYRMTTFVSLYQVSEKIYRQFDKVLVLDHGRQVYFGPASEARDYFEGIGFAPKPRQTTADYLTGCTDEFERDFSVDSKDRLDLTTPHGMAGVFQNSALRARLQKDLSLVQDLDRSAIIKNFEQAVDDSKRKHTSTKSIYATPFHKQVWGNVKQLTRLRWSAKLPLYSFIWTWTVTPFVAASLVYRFGSSSNDAFIRGGTIFLSCMLCTFQSISEMPPAMTGRAVVNKHRSYSFYRPAALWVAQFLVDILFLGVVIFLFSVVQYFLAGLASDAGAFFTFYLTLLLLMLTVVLLFRVGVIVNPDFDVALLATSFLIPFMILTSGFIMKRTELGGWIRWAYWLNPLQYAFTALSGNEFKRVTFECASNSMVPYGPGYENLEYQTCTLAGSQPGSSKISGHDYLLASTGVSTGTVWRGIGILFASVVFFLAGTVMAGEKVAFESAGRARKFYITPSSERTALNEALVQKRNDRDRKEAETEKAELEIRSTASLTWEALTYDVPVAGGRKRLLNDIYGYVEPGHLTALMGASGAGKTTLLDVLAQRKSVGVIGGTLLVDGMVPDIRFQRGTAYCEQQDVHEPTATIREAFRFSAYLRQPPSVSVEEKNAYVEEVISLLELEDLADVVIGSQTDGLAVEERKRVTIGVELSAKPEMLLFLDEPTSGLDSQSAFNIVRFLRKLAAAGQAILCTIHQPNAALFDNFDRLLLLQRGGNTVYFGDIGKDAAVLRGYFGKNGAVCPDNVNVAEWMLDAVGAGSSPAVGNKDWGEVWRNSAEAAKVKSDISTMSLRGTSARNVRNSVSDSAEGAKEYATSFWDQSLLVCKRMALAYYRSPNYGFTRVMNHILVGLWQGLIFLHIGKSRSDLQYRVFAVFALIVLPVLVIFQVQPRMDVSRMVFYREHSSRMYSSHAFTSGIVVAEIPYSVLSAVLFFVCLYLPTGMDHSASAAGFQFTVILFTELFSVTLAQAIQSLTANFFIASLLNPFILVLFTVMSGVMIPKTFMTTFWKSWLYQLNPFTRIISTAAVTALHNVPVRCSADELNYFPIPEGTTCGEYLKDFMSEAQGYVGNASATDLCGYCAFSTGDDFLQQLGISYHDRGRDLGILVAFIASNLVILYLAMRYLNFSKR